MKSNLRSFADQLHMLAFLRAVDEARGGSVDCKENSSEKDGVRRVKGPLKKGRKEVEGK